MYFRNALVRANYENTRLDVVKSPIYLEEFFKVLLYGEEIELRSRFLRIGFEYGTKTADAIANLHQKLPIDNGDLLGRLEKLPIQRPTKRHILLLADKFANGMAFGAVQVVSAVGLKDRAARNLLALMRENNLVESVSGQGKGKVRFKFGV